MKRCDLEIHRADVGSLDVGLVPRTSAGKAFYCEVRDLRPLAKNRVPCAKLPDLFTRLFQTRLAFAVYQL